MTTEQYDPTPEQQREWIETALGNAGYKNTDMFPYAYKKEVEKDVYLVVELCDPVGTAHRIYHLSDGKKLYDFRPEDIDVATKLIEGAMTGVTGTGAQVTKYEKQKTQDVPVPLPDENETHTANITLADVTKYINPMATEQEAMMFLQLCRARNLNPWIGEVHLIKYNKNEAARTVVGKDAVFRKAQENENYDGFEAGIIIEKDNAIEEKEGAFITDSETLVGGWAKVYRKDCTSPIISKVTFDEYAGKKADGSLNKMWFTKPATMIRKVAVVQAHREAFTKELSGMYDEAEM